MYTQATPFKILDDITHMTKREKDKYDILVVDDIIAPCIGCHEVCTPEFCALLDEWLQLLI
jgi:hypothetical protein